jgi:hypothetical protein
MSPVAPGERRVLAQLRPAMIEDGAIVAAGFLADGAGQPALADAGLSTSSDPGAVKCPLHIFFPLPY